METSRHERFEPTAELQSRGFQQLGKKYSTYRRCHLQVIPQQYVDIYQSTDLTKNNLHHKISYLYDGLLIKQDVRDKKAFVLI